MVGSTYILDPTPYGIERGVTNVYPDTGKVKALFLYLQEHVELTEFSKATPIPDYAIAELLDIHRVSWAQWKNGLTQKGYAIPHIEHAKGVATTLLREPYSVDSIGVDITFTPYDPWVDREWDKHFHPLAGKPGDCEYVVDRFYMANMDEKLLVENARRLRDTGSPFRRVIFTYPEKAIGLLKAVPTTYRRDAISAACDGRSLTDRTSPKTETKSFPAAFTTPGQVGIDPEGPLFRAIEPVQQRVIENTTPKHLRKPKLNPALAAAFASSVQEPNIGRGRKARGG